jgi:8-oxo-dGTP diphosphatase
MLVTVDTVIFLPDYNKGIPSVLLIKRENDPFKNSYALPGGFPEMDELLHDAAARELDEETGLKNIELKQLSIFDGINRDPRGRNVSVVFYGFTNHNNSILKAGDDASEAGWFQINELPPLAFDHQEIIEFSVKILRVKDKG